MPGPTITEQRQKIVSTYVERGQTWPATMRQVATWAIGEGLWKPSQNTIVGQLADELARAMREEYYTDEQGRDVRTKHAARITDNGKQASFWDDIRSAGRKHMQTAFQQRRQQIVGDCKQLKTDVDSYNQNGNSDVAIQLVLDFTDDVAEAEALETQRRKGGIANAAKQEHSEQSGDLKVPVTA